ncbi:hypothetical protein [Metaplanococcus flavidus]|uniref:Secreted protein n=1 Tax=Metaplanococcus flavidus TaxID=569883 RepID=A0ABW3LFU5_9BACL
MLMAVMIYAMKVTIQLSLINLATVHFPTALRSEPHVVDMSSLTASSSFHGLAHYARRLHPVWHLPVTAWVRKKALRERQRRKDLDYRTEDRSSLTLQ